MRKVQKSIKKDPSREKNMFLWYLTLIFIFISINFELCILDTLEYEMKKRNIFRGALWWQILVSVKEYWDLMNGGDNFELWHTKNIGSFWGTWQSTEASSSFAYQFGRSKNAKKKQDLKKIFEKKEQLDFKNCIW